MAIISLRDYAKEKHVSYEAIRKQVVRYKDDLGDHIIVDGRQQFLDEYAVAFLDERRKKNPVVVYHQEKDETIEALKQEVARLLRKQEDLRDQIDDLKEYKRLTEEQRLALEDARAAQERRQQELLRREAAMDEEVKTAVQEATEAQKAELDKQKDLEVEKARKEATTAAQAQIKKIEDEKHLLQNTLLAEQARKLTFMERLTGKKKAQVPPIERHLRELQEKEDRHEG